MTAWWTDAAIAAGTVVTALGGGAGLRAMFRRRTRPTRTDAAVALSTGTLRWAEKLEEQTARLVERVEAAERKADAADNRADAAARNAMAADGRAARIERQLEELVSYMDVLLEAINNNHGQTAENHLAHIRAVASRRPVILRKGGNE